MSDKCREILFLLQCAYQQKVISRFDKNRIAEGIRDSLKSGGFDPLRQAIDKCVCLKPEKEHLISRMYQLIKEENDEFFE